MMRIHLLFGILLVCGLISPVPAATYYVSTAGNDSADGSTSAPWHTIQHAADALKPGDTAIIRGGAYRETITLRTSGTPQSRISICAAEGEQVIITGADALRGGWGKLAGEDSPIYVRDWRHIFPIGSRNGVPVLTHPNDRQHELIGRAEQVIEHGRLLRQVLVRQQLAQGTFFADVENKKLYVWLSGGADPGKADMEASTRSTWLVGSAGASYIHLRGLTFRYAANHAQHGALAVSGGQNWLVEDCTFERANASGASLSGRGHIFRRCIFQDNGQLGFGTSGCHDTLMQDCGIYRNNTKGYSTGWEAGGLKVTMSRAFVFDHCRAVDNRGCGIWFDIGNEQAEVKNCYIAGNDEAGIFYEISYGLHAHDNVIIGNANLGESPGGAWGCGGVTLSSSEDCIVENNTLVGNRDGIALREQDRSTPRIDGPRKGVRILNRNHVIRNNIVAYSSAYGIAFWLDTNFFGPHPSGGDKDRPLWEDPKTLNIRLENNLLWPVAGRPNYLYGAPWRPRGKAWTGPAEFAAASGISDSSKVADPLFVDVAAGDLRLRAGSPAIPMRVGVRASLPAEK
jgi:parallel beta-helix repeat protein